ncbi:hypothetical protein CRE_30152 [Caenorhabditis remanei]|uniref:Uncharacterized protein n=1 Tax=Caenorhabditis remanei TaxID=31234 RepID=E3NAK1_CAERE|nr:hypothetical protein CRE_30152 [Caenorhabditis remanei]
MSFRIFVFLLVLMVFFHSTAGGHHHKHHKMHHHHREDGSDDNSGIIGNTDSAQELLKTVSEDNQMLSRSTRAPDADVQGVKRRLCGRKATIFVFDVCGNACQSKTGFNLATHCCQEKCNSDEIKIHCCPTTHNA